MAAVWGEAEIRVHADGSGLPAEVRQITVAAGNEGAKSFNKSFGQRLREGIKDTFARIKGWFSSLWGKWFKKGGKNLGDGFTDGFRDSMKTFKLEFDKMTTDIARRSTDVDFSHWGEDLGNLKRVFPEITDGFKQMAIEGNKGMAIWEPMTEDIGDLHQVFEDADRSSRSFTSGMRGLRLELESGSKTTDDTDKKHRRLRNTMDKLKGAASRAGGGMRNFFKSLLDFDKEGGGNRHISWWKRLSANTRQWTLIIGAVIGAMGQLAGLASAAGSGIFVLAGAFAQLAVGAGLAFVAFKKFMGDIDNVPAALKPARKAFDGFKKSVSDAMDEMTVEAFKGTEDAWKHLGDVVKALQPGFNKIGRVVNGLVQDFAKNLDTKRIERLNKFIEQSGDVLDRVVRAVGRLADGLLTAFTSPAFLRAQEGFLSWLDELIDTFTSFLTGPGFDEWLRHGEDIFGALGGLLETTGRLLNDMVTDETVANLVGFIDNIDRFLQGGGAGILEFAQELDIFGLAAEALADFGDALEPLAGPMADLADAFNKVLGLAIDTLAPIIEDIAEALAPLVQGIADFMDENPDLFVDVLLAIAAGFVAIKAVKIISTIVPGIQSFVNLASGKNATKINKFATAIGGLAVALAGAASTATTDKNNGLAASGGILTSVLGGATAGAIAGPIGILIGAVGGLVANAMTSMFSETDNVWKNGWSQLFDPNDFSGAGIGQIKENIAMVIPEFAAGFETMGAAIAGFFVGLGEKFALGWEQIVTFFTVVIPEFFAGLGDGIGTGFADLGTALSEDWQTIKTAFADGWQAVVEFFTVKIPEFFTGLGDKIGVGFGLFGAMVAVQWGIITSKFALGWQQIVNFFTIKVPGFFTDLWTKFSSGFGMIVANIPGMFNSLVATFSNGFQKLWDKATSWASRIMSKIRETLSQVPLIGGLFQDGSGGGGGGAASGRLVVGPRRLLVGEDGPEAIVPLRRSLSRVNREVRGLSAIAQGKQSPGTTGPGVNRGRTLNIAPGAIVIQGVTDANAVAVGAVNRIAERFAG